MSGESVHEAWPSGARPSFAEASARQEHRSESIRADVLSPERVRGLIEWGRGAEYGRGKLRDFISDMNVTSLAYCEGAAHELECLAALIRRSVEEHRQAREVSQ